MTGLARGSLPPAGAHSRWSGLTPAGRGSLQLRLTLGPGLPDLVVARPPCRGRLDLAAPSDQGTEGGGHRRPEGPQVVPALEEPDRAAGSRGVSGHHRGQTGEVAGGEGEVGERVVPVGVESGGDQYPRRRELRPPPG